jgi:uncharacterized protein DUF4407
MSSRGATLRARTDDRDDHALVAENHSDPPAARPRFSFAWFAGTDLGVLASCPSERRFYDGLGLAVFALSCLSGFSFALAASYWFHVPAASLWWAGVAWALVMSCAIEPLVYQTASRRRFLPLVVAPRVALSLLLAIQIGEPLVLRMNEDAINAQLARTTAAGARGAQARTDRFYNRAIRRDQREINRLRGSERRLERRVARHEFLSSCEATTASCSTTGDLGCGSYCRHYAQLAADERARLRTVRVADARRIPRLQAEIKTLARRRDRSNDAQVAAILKDTGLPARERALAELERKDPAIGREAWFLRLLFIALDLIPLTVKIVRSISMRSPYEERARAVREADLASVHEQTEQLRVRTFDATARADAERAVASERWRAWAMAEINAIWARFRGERIPRADRGRDDDAGDQPRRRAA